MSYREIHPRTIAPLSRCIGLACTYIKQGQLALGDDRAALLRQNEKENNPVIKAIDRYREDIEYGPYTNQCTLDERIYTGKLIRESSQFKTDPHIKPHEEMGVIYDLRQKYVVGFYAGVALGAYEAAKAVASSPEGLKLEKSACRDLCDMMEKTDGLLTSLRESAAVHHYVENAIPAQRRYEMPAPLSILRTWDVGFHMRSLAQKIQRFHRKQGGMTP